MNHRHLDIESDEWNVAVVHSIWERSLEADISALIRGIGRKVIEYSSQTQKGWGEIRVQESSQEEILTIKEKIGNEQIV